MDAISFLELNLVFIRNYLLVGDFYRLCVGWYAPDSHHPDRVFFFSVINALACRDGRVG